MTIYPKPTLMDFVYATLFQRLDVFKKHYHLDILEGNTCPRIDAWSNSLKTLSSLDESLPNHFESGLTSWLNSLDLHVTSHDYINQFNHGE